MGQALIRQKGPAKTAGLWPYQGNRIYPGTLSICHSERPQGAKNLYSDICHLNSNDVDYGPVNH